MHGLLTVKRVLLAELFLHVAIAKPIDSIIINTNYTGLLEI